MQAENKTSIKLLSIDDRSLTTDLDRAGYRSMGVAVKHAKNYQEAYHTIKKESVDVLVINQDYDKVDAVSIVKHMKAQEDTKNLCVVVTGVQANAKKREAVLNAGADLFVEQPIPRQHFIEKMKRLLSRVTRSNDRMPVLGTAILSYEGESIQCPIGDISSTGVLINTGMPLDIGTKVNLQIRVADSKSSLAIEGEIVRVLKKEKISGAKNTPQDAYGLGIKFIDTEKKSIEKILKNIKAEKNSISYYL